ncbi:MAG: thioredoxin family protein [Erysipelotrichia bacterium]|jgi:thiol-disulfide isomerase/thioredoxin|nr:thioredoxin family protein [Erysipelotrichia bacterium]
MKEFINIESKSQFDALSTLESPYILYFTTPTCNVCKSISPKLLKMVEEYPIDIYKVDVSELEDIPAQMLIFNIPTIVVMVDQKEVLREVRFIQFENLERICSLACEA